MTTASQKIDTILASHECILYENFGVHNKHWQRNCFIDKQGMAIPLETLLSTNGIEAAANRFASVVAEADWALHNMVECGKYTFKEQKGE